MNMPLLEHDARVLHYMGLAMEQAQQAGAKGEVPVGAVLVLPGQNGGADRLLAQAHNQPIGLNDPTAHAEMLVLRQAGALLGNYRLDGCELYVTLEPCAMCAQALLHARLARVVYGAREPKTGAAGSVIDVLSHPTLNHHTQVLGGVRAEEAAHLLQAFFHAQRARQRQASTPLRDDALRTPEAALAPLWQMLPVAWQAQRGWTHHGPALDGLRLHWVELPALGQGAIPGTAHCFLALHGPTGWWPQWLAWAQEARATGARIVLPDLVGFGASDKPKKPRWHTLLRHTDVLDQWLQQQAHWCRIVLLAPPEQQTLAQALGQRLGPRLLDLQIRPAPQLPGLLPPDWRELPYPDAGHRAAHKAWPWPEQG